MVEAIEVLKRVWTRPWFCETSWRATGVRDGYSEGFEGELVSLVAETVLASRGGTGVRDRSPAGRCLGGRCRRLMEAALKTNAWE
jgi:hypothetical protein